jgi:hypothetical protein
MKYKAVSSHIALIITLIIVMIGVIKQELLQYDFSYNEIKSENEVIAMSSVDYSLTDDINNFVNNNYDIFKFYADTFEINIEDIKNELILSNANKVFNSYDIANSGITYASLDKNLIDYLFDLEELKPNLFQKKHYDGNKYSKEYIYSLLKYYTNIYDDVDYRTLAGITYIETGNLSSQSMLKYNNIFGAMNNGNLINYKNMSYGILTYVKLMNDKYYGQGLNTLESIGQKFNPVINKYGKKIANPNWVSDIKSVLNKIDSNISTKTILELNSIK